MLCVFGKRKCKVMRAERSEASVRISIVQIHSHTYTDHTTIHTPLTYIHATYPTHMYILLTHIYIPHTHIYRFAVSSLNWVMLGWCWDERWQKGP